MSYSSSANQSGSTSTPKNMYSAQSNYALTMAQLASQLAQDQYNWASSAYNASQPVTEAAINNYNSGAQTAAGQANNLWNQYQTQFEPLNQDLISQAGQYSSTPRVQYNMGAAEANAGSAGTSAINNATQALQSYGIDPSSGMYAELADSQQAARAASEAGAGQEAEINTQNTGRSLLGEAVGVGEQLPGAAVNAINSAFTGLSGAENANLANLNTGASVLDSANPYLSTGMGLKTPPTANTSFAHSSGSSVSTPSQRTSGGGSPSGGGSKGSGSPSGGYGSGTPNGYNSSDSTEPDSLPNIPIGGSSDNGQPLAGTGDNGQPLAGTGDYGLGDGTISPGDYATGGPVRGPRQNSGVIGPRPTSGGYTPYSASPSHGMQTDDIKANLTAGEFVIPRDVTAWKGQEFFQKLIAQSRKLRATSSPARATAGPPVKGPVKFSSHTIGGSP